ncbi:MFS transporter [Pinisolibacter sp.]|uniref:MFS transporter n=1 Tax=Pinisolibacter sp. TaxID=2172024 RepID=UPI002FDE120B
MTITTTADERAIAKAYRRLIPLLFVLYVASFLDRINIGFAALEMNKDLKISAAEFGLSIAIFYIGYILCEVPSNLLLVRFGARLWISRIMITWGLASAATMFAVGAWSLYGLRFLVGVAEAGFLPGVLLYLTYWFPPSHRGRAIALFFLAQPVTIALGSPVSGLFLKMDGLGGLEGWQWLFLLEGLPSVALGFVTLYLLPNGPKTARWLSDEEKSALQQRIEAEQGLHASPDGHRRTGVWAELRSPSVLLLCLAYFGLVVSLTTNSSWTPQIMNEALKGFTSDYLVVGLMTAVPAVCAGIMMPLWSALSDRRTERTWYIVVPMAIAVAGWGLVALSSIIQVRVVGLCLASMGSLTAMTVFWTVPPLHLSPKGRPAGTALINAAGIVGSATAPIVIGRLRDLTSNFSASLWYTAAMLTLSIATLLVLAALGRDRART